MSTQRFSEERLARLYNVMSGYVERGEIPGIVTLLCRRGEVHVNAIGTHDLGRGTPMRRDTICRIASMTKPITAAGALILIEECRLRLDDPVDEWLPELSGRRVLRQIDALPNDTVAAVRPITVRDLLTSRMGYGHLWAPSDRYPILKLAEQIGIDALGPNVPSPDQWLRQLGALPLMYQPGERWMYNTASDVLGVLIARAADQPLEAFLRERLFDPLGMRDTAFNVPPSKIDRLPSSYWTGFDLVATDYRTDWCKPVAEPLQIFDSGREGIWSRPPRFQSGASGLVSTVDDYLAFAQMLLEKGVYSGVRVLSRPIVETMTTNHLTPEQRMSSGYFAGFFENRGWGFGLSVVTARDHPARTVGQFGWDGGLGTSWYSDPAEDMTGILMTQRGWTAPCPPAICRDFWTLAYGAIND